MSVIEEIVDSSVGPILIAAADDWVYLAELQSHVVEAAATRGIDLPPGGVHQPGSDQHLEARISLVMETLRHMFASDYIVPGDVHETFVPWPGTAPEWLATIESRWRALPSPINIADVAWFSITDTGLVRRRSEISSED